MAEHELFTAYLHKLHSVAERGDAREESYYPALAEMLTAVAAKTGRPQVQVTTQPRPSEGGNPDFRLWNGRDRIVGYIEAKNPGEERLDAIAESPQLLRYRGTFPNLILTNFCEFRLYRHGEYVETVQAARPFTLQHLHSAPVLEKGDELQSLLERFLAFSLPPAFTAESLAVELAKRTRFLRDVIAQELSGELALEDGAPAVLPGFFKAFQSHLIGSLGSEDFADLFAQTICYGLFAARIRSKEEFSRRNAFDTIPRGIGVLRELFRFISLGDMPAQLTWGVEDLAEVLAVADAQGILERYYREGKGSDPIIHFYETFLAEYDPVERERRGVYYTPDPVVDYIVRSLHELLKSDFDRSDGLASKGVTLLDPAAGTMTFIARAAELAVGEFKDKYGAGACGEFIRQHVLKNFHAFELMMAPYAVGHLKMNFILEELGHRLGDDERMPFFLTNSLDYEELKHSPLPGFSAMARESQLAAAVKKQTPILVILGNPPYSGHSSNNGAWIRSLIKDYKLLDGKPLDERNPKWLQDDYVKFLRFAQWKIDQAGSGVVGMITNHGYLDNPTFRGMRQSLLQSFDEIYILDLHGNALKKERCPDGSADANVFDIRQGVAIAFFVKRGDGERKKKKKKPAAVVHHADLYGLRAVKYDWLDEHRQATTLWTTLRPRAPYYLFVPRDDKSFAEYLSFPAVTDIFPLGSVGIATARDSLTIQFSEEELWRNVSVFASSEPEMARRAFKLGKDTRDWQVALAQKDVQDSGPTRDHIKPILYRPFDLRYTYYTGRTRGFICMPRAEVMRHLLAGDNMALCIGRQGQVVGSGPWNLAYVAEHIGDLNLFYRGGSMFFPLYLQPEQEQEKKGGGKAAALSMLLFEPKELYGGRRANLSAALMASLAETYGKTPRPEDVFHYVYALLYTPAYRAKYAEFLKTEFPRIPFTADKALFSEAAALGEQLAALHLLRSPALDLPCCRFEGAGDCCVGKGSDGLRYEAAEERVYINAGQYITPVPAAVWSYQVGGYQVCDKWLRDRLGRRLELEEIRSYCRIVTALACSLELQEQLDALYPALVGSVPPVADAD
jgi:hypothetical protein